MTVRNFLDLSTTHLSFPAKAWLSESATLNHAAHYHGSGSGAAMGTIGATLHGYFMHAPTIPAIGMPEDLLPIVRHALANGCNYILFDADAEAIDVLPIFDEDGDRVESEPARPLAFEYFEVRPCIRLDGGYSSFTDEGEFQFEVERLKAEGMRFSNVWTLYGRYNAPDPKGNSQFLAMAIGDFTTKRDAHRVMNAILAPMAAARDLALGDEFPLKPGVIISPAEQAANLLGDFINQSSNMERI